MYYDGFSVSKSFTCDLSQRSLLHAKIMYSLFLLKLIELVETFCFILRGKMNQVSNLHVYHHASTATLCFVGLQYVDSEFFSMQFLITLIKLIIQYYSPTYEFSSCSQLIHPHYNVLVLLPCTI